ncbi:hypothetical protein ACEV9E_13910 [Vibrio parahaemolyticus]|nr:hypothetical protein [Vibrio parahaemolyticus]EIA1496037.1 hypothetical protein [Vibrio parahaemolyticus]EIU7056042.1 hypothetical protein [Vibrio parahaemolyticus]EJE8523131.1 hypothetical protein [Vibrio parahaemolyticus]EJR0961252.1 hypothetical protein [Vibrio parahaemolyticus]
MTQKRSTFRKGYYFLFNHNNCSTNCTYVSY